LLKWTSKTKTFPFAGRFFFESRKVNLEIPKQKWIFEIP